MKFAVIAHQRSATNDALAAAARAQGLDSGILDPKQALTRLSPGGRCARTARRSRGARRHRCGPGELEWLAAGGVDVRKPPGTLVVVHDKLLTARTLRLAGPPHPHTTLISPALPAAGSRAPRRAHAASRRLGSRRRALHDRGRTPRGARAAAAVDLLPTGNSFVVLELNGAVDFRPVYAPHGDVFADAVAALIGDAAREPGWPRPSASPTASSQLRS